jgi:hypothetical protein
MWQENCTERNATDGELIMRRWLSKDCLMWLYWMDPFVGTLWQQMRQCLGERLLVGPKAMCLYLTKIHPSHHHHHQGTGSAWIFVLAVTNHKEGSKNLILVGSKWLEHRWRITTVTETSKHQGEHLLMYSFMGSAVILQMLIKTSERLVQTCCHLLLSFI